jgi:hypothetical protein
MMAPHYQSSSKSKGRPPDNVIIAGFRFMVLALAIVVWPVALLPLSPLLAMISTFALAVTAVFFTTPGDVKRVFLVTPGPVRAGIEVLVHVAALGGAVLSQWPPLAGMAVAVVFLTSLLINCPRLRWLLRGAPEAEQPAPLADHYDYLLDDEHEA